MPPAYTYLSFANAKAELALRLFDSPKIFWSDTELGVYLVEALRTWNSLTSYWRGEFIFPTSLLVRWYDLTDKVSLVNTIRPLTVKDTDLYTVMQYHLLEPVAWNPWTGVSAQFTPQDLMSAVQRRRDEILSITGCTFTRRTVPAVAGRIQLPDTVIDLRRVAYLPAVGAPSILWADDTWAEQSFNRNYTLQPAGRPETFLMSTEPPLTFDPDRSPGFGGQYELLTVEASATLSATTPSTFPIPDDWTHLIKWGALADLLSRESNAKDTLRAQYCEQRYRMGVQLLANAPAVLAMRLANLSVSLQIDSVREADLFTTTWQSRAPGRPESIHNAGLNLLAVDPVPDVGPYSLLANVVANAPIPVLNTDSVQVARDDLDSVLDYAQHLAAFKQGGAEFLSTMPLMQRFLQQAQVYGLKLAELGEFTRELYRLAQGEEDFNPRMAPAPDSPNG